MKFKEYPKVYESILTSDRLLKRCNIEGVTVDMDISELGYRSMLNKVLSNYQKETFSYLVKFIWLSRRFCYFGRTRSKRVKNGIWIDSSYGVYMKHFVGFDNKVLTSNRVNSILTGYLDDFFPDLYLENPFEKELEYPYSYMNFECLYAVYQMPERLELLSHGEESRMKYDEFFDYVINYALSKTDEIGDEGYFAVTSYDSIPFIKYKYYNKYE